MAVKFQVPRKALFVRFLMSPWGRAFVLAFVFTVTLGLGIFTYYYTKYAHIIEDKLRAGPFANTSMLYAAPQPVMLGDQKRSPARSPSICGAADIRNRTATGWAGITCGRMRSRSIPDRTPTICEGAVIKIARRTRQPDHFAARSDRAHAVRSGAGARSPICSTRSARSAGSCTSPTFRR